MSNPERKLHAMDEPLSPDSMRGSGRMGPKSLLELAGGVKFEMRMGGWGDVGLGPGAAMKTSAKSLVLDSGVRSPPEGFEGRAERPQEGGLLFRDDPSRSRRARASWATIPFASRSVSRWGWVVARFRSRRGSRGLNIPSPLAGV